MKNNFRPKLALLLALFLAISGFAFKNKNTDKKNKGKPAINKVIKLGVVKRADFNFKNIEFDSNKSTIRKSSCKELDRVALKLQETKASLKLSGHADSRGTYLYNWKLSKARADAVKNYICNKGCDSSHVAATEFGDTKPIASNKTRVGRQKNRRVELEAF